MVQKLLEKFIAATQDKTTKRGIEWFVNDLYNIVWLVLFFLGVITVVSFSGWWLALAAFIYFIVILGWECIAFSVRTILLGLLYGNPEKTDENGDSESQFDNVMKELDAAIKLFTNEMNGKEKED